jgi:hypothetical protein
MSGQTLSFWVIQGPGWLLLLYLVIAQGLSALNYQLGVRMGTQEPEDRITKVGVAFFWGIAVADLIFYIPLLCAGLIGHWLGTEWGALLLAAALGITIYWPAMCLATVRRARRMQAWSLPKERDYWIVLPLIAGWAALSLLLLLL